MTFPFTSTESFVGPDMENVIVLPVTAGVSPALVGWMAADVTVPEL
ncbi:MULTISPECIES: hypothetical protein [unclassified Paenibacillus]|nr:MULTISPECIES: hypothetical protein [unclassified Paenibacillus]